MLLRLRRFFEHPVLAALLAAAAAVTVALLYLGWRNYQQELSLERQRSRERVENAADAMAAGVRSKVAETRERLSDWLASANDVPVVPGAVVFAVGSQGMQVEPAGGLPFVPVDVAPLDVPAEISSAETLEFAGSLDAAAARYATLSRSGDARVRAEALLRWGRVSRKLGRPDAALAAYRELSKVPDSLTAGGLPASLAGLEGQRMVLADRGASGGREIQDGIASGRWLVSRSTAVYYADRTPEIMMSPKWKLAEALASAWPPAVPGAVAVRDGVIVIARSGGKRMIAAAGFAESLFAGALPAGGFAFGFDIGRQRPGAALRMLGDSWGVQVWPAGPEALANFASPLAMGLLIAFFWVLVYFMARVIRREAAVARLQSDFVAAVSHEFRSPLTTVRQLSEMLEMGQVPSEERRQKYYGVLASEARRLQSLVEKLLNFGRMEAGVERYRREPVDVPALVDRVIREAGPSAVTRVRVDASVETAAVVDGDPEALAVALRNLIDNALKYSPVTEPVEVRWKAGDGVAIVVEDHGPGIPADEQTSVFERFVRGRRAIAESIGGTGVGLAMVRHIMNAHGGQVLLESEPGKGCAFTLQFPRLSR